MRIGTSARTHLRDNTLGLLFSGTWELCIFRSVINFIDAYRFVEVRQCGLSVL